MHSNFVKKFGAVHDKKSTTERILKSDFRLFLVYTCMKLIYFLFLFHYENHLNSNGLKWNFMPKATLKRYQILVNFWVNVITKCFLHVTRRSRNLSVFRLNTSHFYSTHSSNCCEQVLNQYNRPIEFHILNWFDNHTIRPKYNAVTTIRINMLIYKN